jgi:hypothetical protein
MPNLVQTYRLHDVDPSAYGGAVRINRRDAQMWNEKGFGIFHTVQEFRGKRRLENLAHINAWAVDIDKGSKGEMLDRIKLGLCADDGRGNQERVSRLLESQGCDPGELAPHLGKQACAFLSG